MSGDQRFTYVGSASLIRPSRFASSGVKGTRARATQLRGSCETRVHGCTRFSQTVRAGKLQTNKTNSVSDDPVDELLMRRETLVPSLLCFVRTRAVRALRLTRVSACFCYFYDFCSTTRQTYCSWFRPKYCQCTQDETEIFRNRSQP